VNILVVPGEVALIKALNGKALEHQMGFDIQLITKKGSIAIERKEFPGDFLASVSDGRFAKECAAMREVSEHRIVIKEGRSSFDRQGFLWNGGRITRWSRKGIRNLLRSLEYVEGVHIEETESIVDTAERLEELQLYFDGEHKSLRTRQGVQSDWPNPTYQERYIRFLQGLPGISVKRAELIAGTYPNPFAFCRAMCQGGELNGDLLGELPRLGDKTITSIIRFWEGKK